MIKVNIMNDRFGRKSEIIDSAKTIREVLEEFDVNYATSTVMLDGMSLAPGDYDKTFDEIGITDHCYLSAVGRKDNAVG